MNTMISVIMSVYKEPIEWLKESIESILNQSYKNIEYIIILDNPENTDALELIKNMQAKDSRILFIKNEVNLGLPKSLNIAITKASGEFFARMDADDIAEKNRLEIQLNALMSHDADLCGGQIQLIDNHSKIVESNILYPTKSQDINSTLKVKDCVPHPTWLLKRKVYEKLNGYKNIDSIEDYEFLLRAISFGFKIVNTKNVVLKYRINIDSISNRKEEIQFLQTIYLQKNYNRIHLISEMELYNKITKHFTEKDFIVYNKGRKLQHERLETSFYKTIIKKIKVIFYLKKYLFYKMRIKWGWL